MLLIGESRLDLDFGAGGEQHVLDPGERDFEPMIGRGRAVQEDVQGAVGGDGGQVQQAVVIEVGRDPGGGGAEVGRQGGGYGVGGAAILEVGEGR